MSVATTDAVCTPELLDLFDHEKVIEQGLSTFYEVGWALVRIRDGKKYKAAGYSTFEAYLRDRWKMSKSRGYQLIAAARDVETSTAVDKPMTEREARRRRLQQRDHPAPFSDPILAAMCVALPTDGVVLDPFAGTGRIHELATDTRRTIGIEIESEWANMHADTVHGDALAVMGRMRKQVDAIATSPTYGNRMADHHDANDESVRVTYKHTLGHDLADTNTGAMQWGDEYRAFHREAWRRAVRLLVPGGVFVLNIKNHIRDGVVQRVAEWHIDTLVAECGLCLVAIDTITTRGVMAGAHSDYRTAHEYVLTFRKGTS